MTSVLAIVGLVLGGLIGTTGVVSAGIASAACPFADVETATECQITAAWTVGGGGVAANNFPAALPGPFAFKKTLHIFAAGSIDAPVAGITLNIDGTAGGTGALIMDNGALIQANDTSNANGGGPITITATGGAALAGGSTIQAQNTVQAGGGGAISLTLGATSALDGTISSEAFNDTVGNDGGDITIGVTGNLAMAGTGEINSQKHANSGSGGDIDITVSGNMTMSGSSLITSGHPGATNGTPGGDITIIVGNTANATGTFTMEPGSQIDSNSQGQAGDIAITAGRDIDIQVRANVFAGQNASQNTRGQGGRITLIADCEIVVDGIVSSQGQDPGADLVHLEACDVHITGLVESTGAAHEPGAPTSCDSVNDGVPGEVIRPDKPANSSTCVEIWAQTIIIDGGGQVSADFGQSGGTQGHGWIDILADATVTITGSAAGPFAVHANSGLGNDVGGDIQVKARTGAVSTSGQAIQANATLAGGDGGSVLVEAGGNVVFGSAIVEARGATGGGGVPTGGTINGRSYSGSLTGSAPGALNTDAATDGTVTLQRCIGGVGDYGGTITGTLVTPANACAPAAPSFQGYVVFNAAAWAACQPPPPPTRLTLVKIINGGPATLADFTLSANGPTPISGISGTPAVTNALVGPGAYTLSESVVPNYTASAWVCAGGTQGPANVITLAVGDNATCTITNTFVPPPQTRLTLTKTVINAGGGVALDTDWTLIAAGPTPGISGAEGSAAVTNVLVTPGAYTLSETGPAGYTASAWTCTAGTLVGNVLTLAAGDNAVCNIVNTFQPTRLTLIKQVVNAGGGTAVVADWTLTATGPTTITGITGSVAVTNALVTPGVYTLTETGPAGYAAGPWNCTAGTLVGNQLTLAAGQTATCTIINTFVPQPTRLTLVKQIAGGGPATLLDFTLTAAGPTPGISGTSGTAPVTNVLVTPGTYTLSETLVANYSAGPWNCVGGTQVGNQVTLTAGQSATCTIVNTFVPQQIQTHLTLVKNVAGGGPAIATNWTLTATGPTSISGATGSVTVTNALVAPGVYTLTEVGPPSYSPSNWSCTAGTLVGNQLTLAAGESATCTIVNTFVQQAPQTSLTLRKQVVNTGGGTALATAWTLTATGPTTISGATGSPAVTAVIVQPGVYTLTETGPAGYTASTWSCTGGTLVGNQLTLALGDNATCTIVNTFVPVAAATLTPTPTPTPTGSVQAATSRPRITLPPTDTGLLPTSSNTDGGLGVILVLLAGIAAIVPILVRAGQKGARVAQQSEAPRRPTTWTPRPGPTDSTPRRKRDGH